MARLKGFIFFKVVAWYSTLIMLAFSITPRTAAASFISSPEVITRERAVDLEKLRSALESKKVAQRLIELGLSPDEAMERLSKLPDQELHRLAKNIDRLQKGGDALGFIVTLLIIALLVILILELTDHHIILKHKGKH